MTDSQKRTLTVGLLWHSVTNDNLGVGALTWSQMKLITEAAHRSRIQVRFIVFSPFKEKSYSLKEFDVCSFEFSRKALMSGRFDAIKQFGQCDIVFAIGEGDSFTDIYGKKRLIMQVFAKVVVKLFRKPLILSPQTVGPFNSVIGRLLGKVGLLIADHIYVRDTLSMKYLEQLKFQGKSTEVIDVAFSLPFDRPPHHNETLRIGINVSGLLYNGGYTGRNEFGLMVDYRSLIDSVCEYFLSQPDAEVYLVHHVFSATNITHLENDLAVNQLLQKRYPKLQLAPLFHSPIEAKSFISGMHFFTGARMHACIAAFSSGVPVVPMAYSRKFNGLFNSIEYPHVLDCLTVDTPNALKMLIHAFEHRLELAAKVETGNNIAKTKLETYINQISELLAKRINIS